MPVGPMAAPVPIPQSPSDTSQQLSPLGSPLVGGPPPQFAPQLPPQQQPEEPSQEDEVYELDSAVFERPVRIKIDGSSRMVSKDILAQAVQSWLPVVGNGPFLQQLMQAGQTFDFPTFFKMFQDATGTGKLYHLIRPLNQQEEQRLQTPPPAIKAKMQSDQLEAQTRTQIMQMKMQGEAQKTAGDQALKKLQIEEESARHILAQIQQEKADLLASQGDQQKQVADIQLKAASARQDMAIKQANTRQDLQHTAARKQQELQHSQASALQDLMLSHARGIQDVTHTERSHRQGVVHEHVSQQLQHQAEAAKAESILTQGRAKAKAARMQPKPAKKESTAK